MSFARRWAVGLMLLAGCDHPGVSDWVDVDLQGTDQLWSMFPDRCTAAGPSSVRLAEDGYAGAQMVIESDPFTGGRVGITIPDEPISLWLGEADGCQRFDVAVSESDGVIAVSVELACELGWIDVWASTQFTGC